MCKWTFVAGQVKNGGWQDDFWIGIGLDELVSGNYEKIGNLVMLSLKLTLLKIYKYLVILYKYLIPFCFFKILNMVTSVMVNYLTIKGLWFGYKL